MSTTVIALYIAGMLLAIAFILEVVPRIAPGQSIPRSKTYAIIGGSLWPILLVGIIELGSVMAFTKGMQSGSDDELRFAHH